MDRHAAHHVALARVGQLADGCLDRHPARVLDLVVVVGRRAGAEREQEEAHALGDQAPVAAVVVADLAERLDQLGLDAALLADLARRRLLVGLVAVEVALGQRDDARAVGRAPRRARRAARRRRASDDAAGRDLLDGAAAAPLALAVERCGPRGRSRLPSPVFHRIAQRVGVGATLSCERVRVPLRLVAALRARGRAGGGARRAAAAARRPNPATLWATIDVVQPGRRDPRHDRRSAARCPGTGDADEQMYMEFRVEYERERPLARRRPAAQTGWEAVGDASARSRQAGQDFTLAASATHSYLLRGVVTFQWRLHGRAVATTIRSTSAGHRPAPAPTRPATAPPTADRGEEARVVGDHAGHAERGQALELGARRRPSTRRSRRRRRARRSTSARVTRRQCGTSASISPRARSAPRRAPAGARGRARASARQLADERHVGDRPAERELGRERAEAPSTPRTAC